MISVKSKMLFSQAKKVGLKFASIKIDDTEIFYDEAVDGAQVWLEDAEGNQVECPDFEAVEIEGKMFSIKGSKLVEIVEEMEEMPEETSEPTPAEDAPNDFQAQIDALAERLTALEALVSELCKPVEEPVVVEEYSKRKKFDLSRFNIH